MISYSANDSTVYPEARGGYLAFTSEVNIDPSNFLIFLVKKMDEDNIKN